MSFVAEYVFGSEQAHEDTVVLVVVFVGAVTTNHLQAIDAAQVIFNGFELGFVTAVIHRVATWNFKHKAIHNFGIANQTGLTHFFFGEFDQL